MKINWLSRAGALLFPMLLLGCYNVADPPSDPQTKPTPVVTNWNISECLPAVSSSKLDIATLNMWMFADKDGDYPGSGNYSVS
ncbi:MAG: hypothetical protein MI784_14420, partial [Cytophagales bacterium]|nr:hypothetical protein [Cytophagales bacterium]